MNKQKGISSSSRGASIKFTPPIGIDEITKNGSSELIQTRYHSITAMRAYKDKSFEELRYEHYIAENPSVGNTANRTIQESISSVLNPVLNLNPSTRFPVPFITNDIPFPNPPTCFIPTSTFEFLNLPSHATGDPFNFGLTQSKSSTPLISSASMLSSENYTTAAFTSTSPSAASSTFQKPKCTKAKFSRANTPITSSSSHDLHAFRCRRPQTPSAVFSIPTTSSDTSSRSITTAVNFTTTTDTLSTARDHSTAAFTSSNPTLISQNATSTTGRLGFHSQDKFKYSNPIFNSTNDTRTTGIFGTHSSDVFTFSNPGTAFFAKPANTTEIFSTAGTPMSSFFNHNPSTLVFQSQVNPPVTSFPSSRSSANIFNFTNDTAAGNGLRNTSTEAFTFSNPTSNCTITTTTEGGNGNLYPYPYTSSNSSNALFLLPTTPLFTFAPSSSNTAASADYGFSHQFRASLKPNPRTVSRSSTSVFRFGDQVTSASASSVPPANGYRSSMFSTTGTPAVTSSNPKHSFQDTSNTQSRKLVLSVPKTSESRYCQTAISNPQSNESVLSPSTNLPQCIVCLDKERDIAFEPCGHVAVCSTCVSKIGVYCPVCRKVIMKKIKLYIS